MKIENLHLECSYSNLTMYQEALFFHYLIQYDASYTMEDFPYTWSQYLGPHRGYTPLTYTIRWGQVNGIFWLINRAKVDVNETDPEGRIPLMMAFNDHTRRPCVVYELIKKGADVNSSHLLLSIRRMHLGAFAIDWKPVVELILQKLEIPSADFFQLSYRQQKQRLRQRVRNQIRKHK